jgi:hypothetical protein
MEAYNVRHVRPVNFLMAIERCALIVKKVNGRIRLVQARFPHVKTVQLGPITMESVVKIKVIVIDVQAEKHQIQ